MAPKGVSNRTLLAKRKGIKVGQTIVIAYREEGKGSVARYEGVLSDRRIGGTDRESYIELKKCLLLGSGSEIIAHEGTRRFVDAFIDDMDVTEPRPEVPDTPACQLQPSGAAASATGAVGQCGAMAQVPSMPVGLGAGMMPVGMAPMGMGAGVMPMGMGMMPMGMGMMPMGMPMGMGMGIGMGAFMPGMAAMQMAAMAGAEAGGAKSSNAPIASATTVHLGTEPASSPEDIAVSLEAIGEGEYVSVAYTHPRLGKTRYQGFLTEKYAGASNLQSYIQLSECQRIGSRGHVREREATKRLMTAFIDEVKVVEPNCRHIRSHSRSQRKDRSRSGRRNPPKP